MCRTFQRAILAACTLLMHAVCLDAAAGGDRHLVMVVGLPGAEEYRERMTEAVKQIVATSPKTLNVAARHVHLFLSDEEMVDAFKSETSTASISSSSNLRDFLTQTAGQWPADDSCWIIMIGHSQVSGNRSYFQVQGRDFTAEDLGGWLKPIACREQVNFLTMPGSGAWLAALKAPKRINISSTDSLTEYTATEYPYALANVLAGKQTEQALVDIDEDGSVTLLDLYLAVTLEVDQHYRSIERLVTEHALLDDNGDGRGKEIQQPFIPEPSADEADVAAPERPRVKLTITDNSDGAHARTIPIGSPSTL